MSPSHELPLKLRFPISKCDPLRRWCVSVARNAGKVAVWQSGWESSTNHPGEILRKRSCTGNPGAEILHNWSYRIVPHTS